MKKTILTITAFLMLISSCNKKSAVLPKEKMISKSCHTWYYFTDSDIEETTHPEEVPEAFERPWTEAVRLSCAANTIPSSGSVLENQEYMAYGLLNKVGIVGFKENGIEIFRDSSLFTNDSIDSIIFSGGKPVFYLYRSSFFNPNVNKELPSIHASRPFLVEFAPKEKICYPLVTYGNLNLDGNSEITGYFWNGKTWICSAKKSVPSGYEFSYFSWEPLIPLADLRPAMGQETFLFNSISEDEFKETYKPYMFNNAPEELKILLSTLPKDLSFFIDWRDDSGISPLCYAYIIDDNAPPFKAKACMAPLSGYSAAVFSDGTTYIHKLDTGKETLKAFRLPKLPQGFVYEEICIAGNTMYVSWEESNFYMTGRSGLIKVDLKEIN